MSFENNLAFYHPSSLVVLAYQQHSNSNILASIDSNDFNDSNDSNDSIDSTANINLCFIKPRCNFFIIVVIVVVVTLHSIT